MASKSQKNSRTPQSRKRVRQNEKARLQNASQRSAMRTSVKKVLRALLDSADQATVQAAYQGASSLLDRSARKGLIHANKAARLKSRLSAKIKAKFAA